MESFRIRNVKSFTDSGEIEIKPITLFVGQNSCGKSSLLRFLAVLSQTAGTDSDSPIRFYGKMVDYGHYEDVKQYGSKKRIGFELHYKVDINRSYDPRSSNREKAGSKEEPDVRDIILRVVLDNFRKNIVVERFALILEDRILYEICRDRNNKYSFISNYIYKNKEFSESNVVISFDTKDIQFNNFIPTFEFFQAFVNLLSLYDVDKDLSDAERMIYFIKSTYSVEIDVKPSRYTQIESVVQKWAQLAYYNNLLIEISNIFESDFKNLSYIGPFRENPSRIYRDPEYKSYSVGVHGENTSNELIRAYRNKNSVLLNSISLWTKRVLGYQITLKEVTTGLFQIMLKNENGIETNLIDNGYGISQVLPIVTEVIRLESDKSNARASKSKEKKIKRILLLEQPELHLHPAAQSELADLFVDCVLANKEQNRIVIETHSEHLIRKLQVLVASKKCPLSKDMVRIYYVDKDEQGYSYVEEMAMLDNGKFEKPWPSGFFDKGYLLSKELAKAGIID